MLLLICTHVPFTRNYDRLHSTVAVYCNPLIVSVSIVTTCLFRLFIVSRSVDETAAEACSCRVLRNEACTLCIDVIFSSLRMAAS